MLPAMGAALAILVALPALAVRERRMCTPSLCVGGDDGAFDASLISSARVVHRFAPTDPARYLSVLDVGGGGAWLAARRGSFPSADGANISAVVWTGCDAQLRSPGGGACAAAAPVELFRGDAVAHNAGFLLTGGALYAFGGLFDERDPARPGVRAAGPVAATREGLEALARADVARAPVVLGGAHAGGIDRRPRTGTYCEYDGRVSAAAAGGRLVVLARANLARNRTVDGGFGGRSVQAAAGAVAGLGDPATLLGPFFPADVANFAPRGACAAPAAGDNVYFAAVNANPVDASTFLGLFPVVRNGADRDDAYVALAVSCDGVAFSSFRRLLNSTPASLGRSSDHPADGFLVDGGAIYFYVHRGVPGVFDDDHGSSAIAGSRVVRYELDRPALAAYTAEAKASLASCGAPPAPAAPRSAYDRCWLECARDARRSSRHRDDRAVDACFAHCLGRHCP